MGCGASQERRPGGVPPARKSSLTGKAASYTPACPDTQAGHNDIGVAKKLVPAYSGMDDSADGGYDRFGLVDDAPARRPSVTFQTRRSQGEDVRAPRPSDATHALRY